jgi:hypothetical protein
MFRISLTSTFPKFPKLFSTIRSFAGTVIKAAFFRLPASFSKPLMVEIEARIV